MATEDGPPSELTAQGTGKLTAEKTGEGPAQETGKPSTQDTGKLTAPDGEIIGSAESTNEKRKKTPPKKSVIFQNCELCNVILTSQSIVDAHMTSKKHTKRLQAAESMKTILQKKVATTNVPLYRCDVCNITLNSQQQKELHLAGMKHNLRVKQYAEENEMCQQNEATVDTNSALKKPVSASNCPAGGTTTETDSSMAVQAADLKCTVCNITVNSVQQLSQHLSSKKHQLKENGLKRPTPYNLPRRGGLGRGAPGSFETPRTPGAFGGRGRGRGRGQGPGPGRGRGRGGGPKLGGVNSLKSNFQSAGFTSNFQGFGGQQSLKRERTDISFGNGSNEDISTNSYYQGKKIPRGALSAPFNSVDSMDNNSFRSGYNAFGSGNNSFGSGNSALGGGKIPFGSGNRPFGRGSEYSRGGNNKPFGRGNKSFGGGNNSFGGDNPFGGRKSLYGGGSDAFGWGGDSTFGGGNSSFGGGNNFGREKPSYGGGKASVGRGDSTYGNNFVDFSNSLRGGFGRGNTRGIFERGRGFGPRSAFNSAV